MMPPSTSESHTFLPNSVVLGALPLRIMAVCSSKTETSFSVAGTSSPSNSLRRLCEMTCSRSPAKWESSSRRLPEEHSHFAGLLEQVISQSRRRVFEEEEVPATEKLVSVFEEHTAIIRRGKARKQTE